jgi:hypothetical protein
MVCLQFILFKIIRCNSIEAEITGDAFLLIPLGNVNDATLSNSKYGDKTVLLVASKWRYANDKWSTTISTFFEYAQEVVSTIHGDVNNDGATGNDLIYIPTTAEIIL